MKLKDNLYEIQKAELIDKGITFCIKLDAEHVIYKAHFPGQPITPGVCILQIAKELLEEYLHTAIELKKVNNVKFLSVISPLETPFIRYELNKIEEEENGKLIRAQMVVCSDAASLVKISFICNKL